VEADVIEFVFGEGVASVEHRALVEDVALSLLRDLRKRNVN
jgi:hypothetical protein